MATRSEPVAYSDADRLARASGVGLALGALAVAEGATAEEAAAGGEDYELLIATPDPDRLVEAFGSAGLRPPVDIGACTGRPGVTTLAGDLLPEVGWRHRF